MPRSENTRRSHLGRPEPKKGRSQMEDDVKQKIKNLSDQGLSQRKIADIMNKHQRSIWNVLNEVY